MTISSAARHPGRALRHEDAPFFIDRGATSSAASDLIDYGAPSGSIRVANTTRTNTQDMPQAAALTNGGFVIVWRDGSAGPVNNSIHGQMFDATGSTVGGEIVINSSASNTAVFPSVAAQPNGGFVVTWGDRTGGTLARTFDSAGYAAAPQYSIQQGSVATVNGTSNTSLPDGTYMAVWQATGPTNGGVTPRDVHGRVFSANGTALSADIVLSASASGNQYGPTVTAVNGSFVATWLDDRPINGQNLSYEIMAQRFSATGSPVGGEFHVSPGDTDLQYLPAITALPNGGFVIAWVNSDSSGDPGDTISAQFYSAAGTPIGGIIDVSRSLSADGPVDAYFSGLSVVADTQGGLIVSWSATIPSNPATSQLLAQQIDSSGDLLGGVVATTDSSTAIRNNTAEVRLASGQIVGVWDDNTSYSSGTSESEIVYQIFDVFHRIVGSDGADMLSNAGGRVAAIDAKGGDDIITGAAGDQIDAGDGNDQVTVTGVGATIYGGAGNDVISADIAAIYGGAGNDRIVAARGGVLDGGEGDDQITANGGDGYIYGGGGDDLITLTGNIGLASISPGAGTNQVTIDVTATSPVHLFTEEGAATTASIRVVASGPGAFLNYITSVNAHLGAASSSVAPARNSLVPRELASRSSRSIPRQPTS